LWITWAASENRDIWRQCKTTDQYYQAAYKEIDELGGKLIHYGVSNSTNTRKCKLPENLLILLWLLRYAIYDDLTLNNLKIYFSPDSIKDSRDSPSPLYNPSWIKNYILIPCMTVYDIFNQPAAKAREIYIKECIGNRNLLLKRSKESILHKLTATFIDIIITNGEPEVTSTTQNMLDIKEYISKQNTDENIAGFTEDYYTLFFTSIPQIIEGNVENHWRLIFKDFYQVGDFVTEKSWPVPASAVSQTRGRSKQLSDTIQGMPGMDRFQFNLPYVQDDKTIPVTIKEFFFLYLAGNIPLAQLTQKTTLPSSLYVRSGHKSLREVPRPNYNVDDKNTEKKKASNERKQLKQQLKSMTEHINGQLETLCDAITPKLDDQDQKQFTDFKNTWKNFKDNLDKYM